MDIIFIHSLVSKIKEGGGCLPGYTTVEKQRWDLKQVVSTVRLQLLVDISQVILLQACLVLFSNIHLLLVPQIVKSSFRVHGCLHISR